MKNSAADLRQKLEVGETTPTKLLAETLAKIEQSETNAFVGIFESAKVQAENLEKDGFDATKPLWGIPIALKDNILFKDEVVTAASRILQNYRAPYSATVVQKLQSAGAIIVGRTNMDEFAMGDSTETSFYGITKNPLAPDFVPGGSSGGSAAAIAEGILRLALGTDTGGSVRQPAAFCGLVGFKPTYGAISRYGTIAMSSSFDQVGTFSNNVSDARALFEAIQGVDKFDSTTVAIEKESAMPKTIGVPRSFVENLDMDADVLARFNDSIDKLKAEGFVVKDIEIPYLENSLAVYSVIMSAEVSSNLARFDGVRYGHRAEAKTLSEMYERSRGEGFGDEVKRRIILGTYVLSAGHYDTYYKKATALSEMITASFRDIFTQVDLVATPTTPTPAFKIGEDSASPLTKQFSDIFTVSANIAGLPAISIPSGEVLREGVNLPLGLQLMAARGKDTALFTIGEAFERIK